MAWVIDKKEGDKNMKCFSSYPTVQEHGSLVCTICLSSTVFSFNLEGALGIICQSSPLLRDSL